MCRGGIVESLLPRRFPFSLEALYESPSRIYISLSERTEFILMSDGVQYAGRSSEA
jgi:hypothetical protein